MTLTIQGPAWDLSAEYADIDDPRVAEDMRSLATIFDNVEENNVQLNNTAVELAQSIRKAHDEALALLPICPPMQTACSQSIASTTVPRR